MDTSEKGLGAVLSQKQADGQYHPIAYASHEMNETEQRYHSNKQEFLALKWAVTEQFHEYLLPYGKNRNEFVVRTDNNLLTYIFSTANLDAAGQRWVDHLTSYNFSLEYQKGKDNTVADFLSQMNKCLPEEEVQEYLNNIPYAGARSFCLQLGGVVVVFVFFCFFCNCARGFYCSGHALNVLRLLGNVVRVYPRIVQGLTFLSA